MVGRFADDTEQSVSQAVASDCAAIRSLQTKDSSETSVIFSFSFLFFLSLSLKLQNARKERKGNKRKKPVAIAEMNILCTRNRTSKN